MIVLKNEGWRTGIAREQVHLRKSKTHKKIASLPFAFYNAPSFHIVDSQGSATTLWHKIITYEKLL